MHTTHPARPTPTAVPAAAQDPAVPVPPTVVRVSERDRRRRSLRPIRAAVAATPASLPTHEENLMPATTPTPLRRLPMPRSEPPFDDEIGHRRPAVSSHWVQGALALTMPDPTPVMPIPRPSRPRTPLRLVPDPSEDRHKAHKVPCDDDDDELFDRPIPAVHRPWIARLAQALLEALDGERPHGQLLPWTSDRVYTAIANYADSRARRRPNVDLTRRAPAHVRNVLVSKPAPAAAEVCALVQRGPRTQAVALRLEAWRGRWRCTAFELA